MIVDCIADLHGHYPKLDGGDLLIVAGDLTGTDSVDEHDEFEDWLECQPYRKIVFIAGNHDNFVQARHFDYLYKSAIRSKAEYLCDSGTDFEGLEIWGCPWTKTFWDMNPTCKAFTVDTEDELMEKFDQITGCPDILITHSPPYGILDGIPMEDGSVFHAGSKSLLSYLKNVLRPKLHVFGHIHEGYGKEQVFATYDQKMMDSVNASLVNEHYRPVNKPIRIIL